jgi:hypothetical protein
VNTSPLQLAALRAVSLGIIDNDTQTLHRIAAQHSLPPEEERMLPKIVSDIGKLRRDGALVQTVVAQSTNYTDADLESIGIAHDTPDIRGWLLSVQLICATARSENGGAISRGALWSSFKTYPGVCEYFSSCGSPHSTKTAKLRIASLMLGVTFDELNMVDAFAERHVTTEGSRYGNVCCYITCAIVTLLPIIIGAIANGDSNLGLIFGGAWSAAIALSMPIGFCCALRVKRTSIAAANSAEEQYVANRGLHIIDITETTGADTQL